ncbi:F0F1 ATP synthase subunit gamma [Lichenicoccus sp.]|uniref:F0F1 ATP synthase subunit gamma n=1 Tax=Lichenicoccus sp. TaxID=2781899 RepID=UPI003D0B0512
MPKRPALILICAEQGFAGPFSVRVLDMVADDIGRSALFPLDAGAFVQVQDDNSLLLTLAPARLVDELTAKYMHAQLCAAALHGFAAENAARMEAVASARNQIQRQLADLQAVERQVRQEEITAEIIELAAGETASRERV